HTVSCLKRQPPWRFDEETATRQLCEQFQTLDLNGFGCNHVPLAICAAGCLLQYVKETQNSFLPHIRALKLEQREDSIIMDAATRRNLEIEYSIAGHHQYTLAGLLDHCATPMGSRLLRRWLNRPLRDHALLHQRQQIIAELLAPHQHGQQFEHVFLLLKQIGDVERILTRIALKSARPRDLSRLRSALAILPALHQQLDNSKNHALLSVLSKISQFPEVHALLTKAIIETPPLLIRDGGVIAPGYDQELDKLQGLQENADQFLSELEEREKQRSGINTLKVGYNRVHGYYIEISRMQSENVPAYYQRRQTLKAAERYITPELKELEDQVLSAHERALAREKFLYEELLEKLHQDLVALQTSSRALAKLDVLNTLAERASTLKMNPPELSDTLGICIKAGRHPVIEQAQSEPFTPNDIDLHPEQRMLIITGPNMGGKSTYMRQTALIVLMAHIGSYIPAESAQIGNIDRIFTRIGAADDLASGRSTFMVEMTETANILHNATEQSLILMDEVGRGTSTFDGLSLAWACAENLLNEIKAYTLFATHFFELTQIPEQQPHCLNVHLDAVEHEHGIAFMHKVKSGSTNQSYGLQVAALAGVPRSVVQQAQEKLADLENQTHAAKFIHASPSIQTKPQGAQKHAHAELDKLLDQLNPDDYSPRSALDLLYRIKKLL
ncbi:MAG: DNA mismatch repair protein MutS, partial [Gammaproteobacteria bacterium]|nr:DNA mismatch repair protein MutS [Gammaproteobacteria bacterium]